MRTLDLHVRALTADDRAWVRRFLQERWGAVRVVSRGHLHQPDQLPGFIAVVDDNPLGLLTYHIADAECEVVTLDSAVGGVGIGTQLLDTVYRQACQEGCSRLWLITTNDNTPALRFYQKRGFVLAALHRDAIRLSRQLKPEIPQTGVDGIPLRDEIELEISIEL